MAGLTLEARFTLRPPSKRPFAPITPELGCTIPVRPKHAERNQYLKNYAEEVKAQKILNTYVTGCLLNGDTANTQKIDVEKPPTKQELFTTEMLNYSQKRSSQGGFDDEFCSLDFYGQGVRGRRDKKMRENTLQPEEVTRISNIYES